MATKQQTQATPEQAKVEETALVPLDIQSLSFDAMLARPINSTAPIKSIRLKTVLTKPLVSVAHVNELWFQCTSEMYTRDLPMAGRTDKIAPATLIDGIDMDAKAEITLILNAVMKSSLEAAKPPLIGRAFGFRAGDIKADKKYRIVDVVEIEVER